MQPQMLKIPLRNPHDCRPKKLKKFLIFYKRFEEKNAQDPRDLRKKCSRSPPSRDPLDYGPKKSKKCSILYARFEKKMLKIPPSPPPKTLEECSILQSRIQKQARMPIAYTQVCMVLKNTQASFLLKLKNTLGCLA